MTWLGTIKPLDTAVIVSIVDDPLVAPVAVNDEFTNKEAVIGLDVVLQIVAPITVVCVAADAVTRVTAEVPTFF
jgi:hypothetical protein